MKGASEVAVSLNRSYEAGNMSLQNITFSVLYFQLLIGGRGGGGCKPQHSSLGSAHVIQLYLALGFDADMFCTLYVVPCSFLSLSL